MKDRPDLNIDPATPGIKILAIPASVHAGDPAKPSAPAKAPRPRKPDKANPYGITEAEVQRQVLAILAARNILAWRSNSRVFMVPDRKGKDRLRPMRAGLGKGSADVIGVLPCSGRVIAVECKRPGKRPTADQIAWLRSVNTAGGLAFWVDDAVIVTEIFTRIDSLIPRQRLIIDIEDSGIQQTIVENIP